MNLIYLKCHHLIASMSYAMTPMSHATALVSPASMVSICGREPALVWLPLYLAS